MGRSPSVVLGVAAAIWFSYAGVKHGLAGHYAASSNADDWLRASQIEPADAEHWYQLGRFRQLDFDHTDLPLAVSYYRRAVQLNPYSPYYKLDLAGTLEMIGSMIRKRKNIFAPPRMTIRFPRKWPGNTAIFCSGSSVCRKLTRKFIAPCRWTPNWRPLRSRAHGTANRMFIFCSIRFCRIRLPPIGRRSHI